MAASKPSKPQQKPATAPKAKKPASRSVMGNDPFARGSAIREVVPEPAPTTELQAKPTVPSRRPARPARPAPVFSPQLLPQPHAASPSLGVDPEAHAGAPAAVPLNGSMAHSASPSLGVDPLRHEGTPTAQPLKVPAPHPASPNLGVDPQSHPDTPMAEPLNGATAHAASPSLGVDPLPHEGTPMSEPLVSAAPHPSSPTVVEESMPVLVRRDERPSTALASPSVKSALKGLFNAVRSSAGFSSRTTQVDHWGKDAELTAALRPLGDLLYEKYWRVQVEGAEHLPSGAFIIVANHAGALPLDGPVLHSALRRERPDLGEARWLLEDQLFHAPFFGVLANRVGAVRANPENALRLLAEQHPVIVFPEGFHGLSKPFSERYQLRRFGRGGYIKIALRAGVPIVPAAIIGGEESMPLLGKIPGGLFGVQYLPITVPPLPARWHIRFAAPVSLAGQPQALEYDLSWVERKNAEVREQIESMLTHMLQRREHVF